jgi:hypothetical protein
VDFLLPSERVFRSLVQIMGSTSTAPPLAVLV